MNKIIISLIFIANLFFAITSCSNKKDEINKAIDELKVAFSDSLFFEIRDNTNSTITHRQSVVLWYWDDKTVVFMIKPISLNIAGDTPWIAEDATSENGLTSIEYNGKEYEAKEYITHSKGVKLGLKLNIYDTSLASVRVISDTILEVTPSSSVMIREK